MNTIWNSYKKRKFFYRFPIFDAMFWISIRRSVLVLLFCCVGYLGYSQSFILLLGGQSFSGELKSETFDQLIFQITKKNGKSKDLNIWKDQVFSITTAGVEKFYYQPDSNDEMHYSVEEMRLYVYGQQDARENHKTTLPMIVGFTVSGVLGAYLGSKNSALVIVTPVAGTLIGSATKNNKPKQKNARSEKILASPAYIEGYRKGARGKKIFHTIAASIVGGLAGGIVGLASANESQP